MVKYNRNNCHEYVDKYVNIKYKKYDKLFHDNKMNDVCDLINIRCKVAEVHDNHILLKKEDIKIRVLYNNIENILFIK